MRNLSKTVIGIAVISPNSITYIDIFQGVITMTKPLFKGMEGVFIPVKNPAASMKWYEDILGFKRIYHEEDAAVMRIGEESQTVICLVKTKDHQAMHFPDNSFGVSKYYNFYPDRPIEDVHALFAV